MENMLSNMQVPQPENIMNQSDLKMPFLSYRRSSKAGLWLLLVPGIVAVTVFLKTGLYLNPDYVNFVHRFFSAINNNEILTYLIPVIFIGMPLLAIVLNFLAICHFQKNKQMKELIVTIKYRPLNIAILLLSFAILIFFLLPDKLSF